MPGETDRSRSDEGAGERDEILEPERLEPDRRAERLQFVLHRFGHEVIAGDDGDGDLHELGASPNLPQELQAVGDRHAHVEDYGVWPNALRECESHFGVQRRGDGKPFELQHPCEGIRDGKVVVDYENSAKRGFGERPLRGRDHRIILKANEIRVKPRPFRAAHQLYKSHQLRVQLTVLFRLPGQFRTAEVT